MKRIALFSLGLVLAFSALASAQTPPANPTPGHPVMQGPGFVDLDGDGICDNFQNRPANGRGGQGLKRGRGYGPGDGTGNMGAGPKDGTGYGPGAGTGNCTGTGPQGARRGPRR